MKMKLKALVKELQFHGGRRLGDKNYKWFWILTIIVLFSSAVTVILITVWRFFDNPTFMVIEETVDNKMDFPSVIVCPEVFFRGDKIDKFLTHIEIPPHFNTTYLKVIMPQLGAFLSPDVFYKPRDLENLEKLLEYNNMDVDTAGRLLTTSCGSTLIRCRWQGKMINCSDVFHMRLTADGYCCVFNGRSLSRELTNANLNEKYRKWQTESFGFGSGLMLAVNQSQHLFDVDLSYKWLALQTSRHYVESTINGSALNPGSEQWVAYYVKKFTISDEARSLSNSLRHCRLTNEPLTFFPLYTKKYCVVECEMAETLKSCNCVRLVHPRPKGAPYCNTSRLLCAKQAMVPYDSDKCNCPAACDVATDYLQVSSFQLLNTILPIDPFYDNLDYKKVTIVRTFIQNNKVKTYSRRSYFSKTDLFSQLGGVFSVFFGCSLLTLLELGILAIRSIIQLIRSLFSKKKTTNVQHSNIDTTKGKMLKQKRSSRAKKQR